MREERRETEQDGDGEGDGVNGVSMVWEARRRDGHRQTDALRTACCSSSSNERDDDGTPPPDKAGAVPAVGETTVVVGHSLTPRLSS